jgi:glutamyl-tRNA reductase
MREQLAFSAADLQVALVDLRNYASEGFIISTCNRVEIGGLVAEDWHGPEALLHFLADHHGVPLAHLTPHLYAHHGEAAAQHLFRLAAGAPKPALPANTSLLCRWHSSGHAQAWANWLGGGYWWLARAIWPSWH